MDVFPDRPASVSLDSLDALCSMLECRGKPNEGHVVVQYLQRRVWPRFFCPSLSARSLSCVTRARPPEENTKLVPWSGPCPYSEPDEPNALCQTCSRRLAVSLDSQGRGFAAQQLRQSPEREPNRAIIFIRRVRAPSSSRRHRPTSAGEGEGLSDPILSHTPRPTCLDV